MQIPKQNHRLLCKIEAFIFELKADVFAGQKDFLQ